MNTKMKRWIGAGAVAALLAAGALSLQPAMAQTATPPADGTTQAAPRGSRSAQGAGQQPAVPGNRGGKGGRGGLEARQAVTVTGTLAEYTINHGGDYDGFSLSDGTLVRVPPAAAVEVKNLFAVGASVEVQGYQHPERDGATAVSAKTISSGSTVYTVEKPAERPAPPASETATVSGAITRLGVNDNEDLDGFYLGDQTLVSVSPRSSDDLQAKLAVGAQVEVTGEKRVGTSGLTVIRAQEIKGNGEVIYTAPQKPGRGHGGSRGPRMAPPAQEETANPGA